VIDPSIFVPVYGPFKEYERLVMSYDEPFEKRLGYAVVAGGATGAHYIFGLRHLAHIQAMGGGSALNYMHARSLMTRATTVMPALGVGYGVLTTSVGYEQAVNKPIRQGTRGTWFGPFASGLGSVV
jgi:hypothetical protein